MPYYPTVNPSAVSQQVVDTFRGYNRNLKIDKSEFHDMKNLTSDYYPLLANRRIRGKVAELTSPTSILAKSELAYVDGTHLMYGNVDISTYLTSKGLAINPLNVPKQLVSMGAYIVIFPDKLYINTANYSDCGSIEASVMLQSGTEITYTMCHVDGDDYTVTHTGATPPENPVNGDIWLDTSGTIHVLKEYSDYTGMFSDIPTVYTKISAVGIGAGFSPLDGVTISGCSASGSAVHDQISMLNGSKIIYACSANYIVVIGILDETYTQVSGTVSVGRTMPDLDFITEANNRLWGCKYGLVNGETVNSIYCCALGDFKNWSQFLGTAADSWFANVGTDGPWTGAITHLGYPIFFKENYLHKVYISDTGAHRVVDTACRGVQKGSDKSLVVVNEHLFYKAVSGVVMYDGSLPVSVSEQFDNDRYFDAAAGSLEDKYYISMRDANNVWTLFVYDSSKGMWHKEDNTHALYFARLGDELYFIDDSYNLMSVNGTGETAETEIEWYAESGVIGYRTVEQQYVSRLNIRMILPETSMMDMFIEYDSSGQWEFVWHMDGVGLNSFTLPLRPRRCDHFRFRMVGIGDVRIYSIAQIHETGSDYV